MSFPTSAWRPRRLPAGALLLVLAISIIVTSLLLSLIFLATNRRLLVQRDTMHQQLRRNLFSGLAYAQAHPSQPAFQSALVDLFGDGNDSVKVIRKPWGVFDVAVLTAGKGPFRDTAVALLGSHFSYLNQGALYLTDENVPLAINEDAQVRGAVWLPKKGDVRPGSLPLTGERRTGEPVTGTIRSSQPTLPLSSDSALARLRAYAQLQLTDLLPAGSQPAPALARLTYSFVGVPAVWYHEQPFTVQGRVAGQVVVASARRLVVEASCQLDNVLLLAPVVIVKAGFRGRLQIIARDTAIVENNCLLAYPSAVCTYSPGKTTLVSLGEGSLIQGVVIATAAEPGLGCLLRMVAGTTVEGQLFSAGAVENCGTVRGTLMCRRLMYHTVGSFYENYLVNCRLDRLGLSPDFLTTPLLNRAGGIGVVAWLK